MGCLKQDSAKMAQISALELTELQRYKESTHFLYKLPILGSFVTVQSNLYVHGHFFSAELMETQSAVQMASRNDHLLRLWSRAGKVLQFPFVWSFHNF